MGQQVVNSEVLERKVEQPIVSQCFMGSHPTEPGGMIPEVLGRLEAQ